MIDQETLKNIEDLHRLKNDGIITEDEFDKAKARLLFGQKMTGVPNPFFAGATGTTPPPPRPAKEDFKGWVMMPLQRYADFTGRSSRTEYWLFQLALAVLGIFIFALLTGEAVAGEGASTAILMLTAGVAILGLIVPLMALQARRFHDQDKSAWFVLINFVPYVGAFIVLAFMLIEGTQGENQYGPDPWQD